MIFAAIDFPNLNPAAITLPLEFDLFGAHLGPFPLRWYALAYIAGLILGWRWMVWLINREQLWKPGKASLSAAQADDFLFWATLGVILGGRLGYVLFYKPDMIWLNPAEILQIWKGGMSFHGGLIGVVIASWRFTRRPHVDEAKFAALAKGKTVEGPPEDRRGEFVRVSKLGWIEKTKAAEIEAKARTAKIELVRLGDLAAAATPIGLFFGRIANFINGELWGRASDAPWAMVFCNEHIRAANYDSCPAGIEPRHPSQLYEAALEGVALFAVINLATLRFDSLRRPGMNIGLFLACYGLIRLALEFVREPDAHMPEALRGYFTMGMVLSLPMIGLGAWLIWRALKTPAPAPA